MTGSEVRALFAAAARPGVISLAGGMPFVEAIPPADVLAAGLAAIDEGRADALQYTGGQGLPALRERLSWLASLEGVEAPPDKILVTVGGQQGLDVVGKVFIDPGDPIQDNMMKDLRVPRSERIPITLTEAIEAFSADELMHELFRPRLYETFLNLRQDDLDRFWSQVSAWELDFYLERWP